MSVLPKKTKVQVDTHLCMIKVRGIHLLPIREFLTNEGF